MGIFPRWLRINSLFVSLVAFSGCGLLLPPMTFPVPFSKMDALVGKTFKAKKDLFVTRFRDDFGGYLFESKSDNEILICSIPKGTVIKVGHISHQYHMETGLGDFPVGYVPGGSARCRRGFMIVYSRKINGQWTLDPERFEEVDNK